LLNLRRKRHGQGYQNKAEQAIPRLSTIPPCYRSWAKKIRGKMHYAPPLKLDHRYEDSFSLELNDGQNQIIIYRAPLNG
jgi:hypothetical protein